MPPEKFTIPSFLCLSLLPPVLYYQPQSSKLPEDGPHNSMHEERERVAPGRKKRKVREKGMMEGGRDRQDGPMNVDHSQEAGHM